MLHRWSILCIMCYQHLSQNKEKKAYGIFIDLQKAPDSVPHNYL